MKVDIIIIEKKNTYLIIEGHESLETVYDRPVFKIKR